jgi:ankyrin repeat protein
VLLAHGANMDVVDRLERTAWMYAGLAGHEEIAKLLNEAKAKK